MKRRLIEICLGILLAVSVPQITRGTDIPIFPTGPVFQLKGLVWGNAGPQGFNNNFFFTPSAVNESVCVYVKNNNTSNPHTFVASITINADANNVTPSDGTWQNIAASSLTAATSPGVTAGIGASVSGVAQVSINFSTSSVQAGSPETAAVSIVQTANGNCASGNNFVGSAPNTVAATIPLQAVSDGLSQGFVSAATLTNPVGNSLVIHINDNNTPKSLYFDKVILSCTAACTFTVASTTNLGSTCSAAPAVNMKISSSVAAVALGQSACTGLPTSFGSFQVDLAANTPFVFDLRGFISPSLTTTGLDVICALAVTGNVRASLFWYEK
jgi:hypothetical protein